MNDSALRGLIGSIQKTAYTQCGHEQQREAKHLRQMLAPASGLQSQDRSLKHVSTPQISDRTLFLMPVHSMLAVLAMPQPESAET